MNLITRLVRQGIAMLLLLAFAPNGMRLCAATVTRGPYLQQGTTNSAVVRWRTSTATDSAVRYGLSLDNLSGLASAAASVTDHVVMVSGLLTDTKYFYQCGTSTNWFPSDTNNFFFTLPPPGIPRPVRIWALGDSGTGTSEAAAVRDGYTIYNGTRRTDLWLMLGDNAYSSGLDTEFQTGVFDMYPTYLRNNILWLTLGNHDASSTGPNGVNPYFDIFTLPQNGEAGGLPSGTEHYYSFDYANIHFICLDTAGSDRSSNGPMCTWVKADLAAAVQDWNIAFWHHPPYTKGSHDSDAESNLIETRQNMVPIMESYGVDLVLCGHSHSYERSYLLDGHYGLSSTLTPAMKVDGGDGREDGTGAYRKPAGISAHHGAVYTVAGSSGHTGGGSLNHPAMVVSLDLLGSLVIDVNGDRLDLVFLETNGLTGDHFTLIKAAAPTNAPAAPTNLIATALSTNQISLTWADTSDNEAGFKLERSTNGVTFVQFASVSAGATNKTDSGLAPGTLYYYQVRAFNAVGDSPYSGIAQASTLAPPADVIPPAAVTNLAVTSVTTNSASLLWTAPGDDGKVGTAAFYDIRYSTAPIAETNWTAAIQAVGEPAPALAGTSQAFTINGLASGVTYYFGLKTSDETNNLSPLSNVPSATTRTASSGDVIPPAAVTNLAVTSVTSNRATLAWTAPGNDGNVGTAASYDVRYSTVLIAETNWAAATQASGGPAPALAGTAQSFTVTGLLAGVTYYFGLKTADETNNISPLSNIPTATTSPTLSPPAAPSGLRVTAVASNEIDLVWTDNSTNEDGFKVERATDGVNFVQITNLAATITNFADRTVVPGSTDSYRVRAYNAAGNSAYSNTNSAQAVASGPTSVVTLISSNSVWKYLDDGSNQSNTWTALTFNDASWASGRAILGYNGGRETTTVSFGTNATAKYITTYFRRHFTLSDPSAVGALTASVLRDDGAVVYINGTEVFRSNMATGAIDYLSGTPISVTAPDKYLFHDSPAIDPAGLTLFPGDNVVAVEVHQHSASSSAMDFDLQLFATNGLASPTITVLSCSANPALAGASVTVTATVTNGQNGAPIAAGTVTFTEGSSTLAGPISLNGNGQASFTTNGLSPGAHTITASYNGIVGTYNSSLSTLSLTICPGLPSIALAPAALCPNSTDNEANGPAGATAYSWSITNGTITSPTNLQTISYSSGASGSVGLTLLASNATGCVASSSTNVPVLMETAVVCPPDTNVTSTGNCPAVVSFALPAGGNCLMSLAANPPSGTAFPVGTNVVTVTSTDAAGDTNTCTFRVIVQPGPAPPLTIVSARTNVVLSWPNGFGCYTLQFSPSLARPISSNVWNNYTGSLVTNGGSIFATNSVSISNLFYRLRY